MFATSNLLDRWCQRFGGRHRRSVPRPLAAMGYLTDGPVVNGLIDITKLILVLLYDESIRPQQCALRLAGYGCSRVAWGVCFGGRANRRFAKDLMLQPMPGTDGYRLDTADEELLALGLDLDRELGYQAQFNERVRQWPLLPKLWAGFRCDVASTITAGGPELAAYSARVDQLPAALLDRLRLEHDELTLFPLAWVSHHWQQAAAVFADLRQYPKRQVFHLESSDSLAGYHQASEFDFQRHSSVQAQAA